MRVLLRRERRRRNVMDYQGNALPLPHSTLVDKLDLLRHPTRSAGLRVLVTRNHFLATGIRHSPLPLCHTTIYDDLSEALHHVRQSPPLSLIIDLEGWSVATLPLLNQLRELHQTYPALDIALIAAETETAARLFLQSACSCRFIDRRLALKTIRNELQLQGQRFTFPPRGFKAREWSVLILMAQGRSLSEIARLQERPYHRVVYRMGCVLTLLGLGHRHQLLRLLQKINGIGALNASE